MPWGVYVLDWGYCGGRVVVVITLARRRKGVPSHGGERRLFATLVLEELDDLLQVAQAHAMLGVANVHLLTEGTKL